MKLKPRNTSIRGLKNKQFCIYIFNIVNKKNKNIYQLNNQKKKY